MSTIAIVVQQTAKAGKMDEYLQKMIAHAKASRAEPGCLRFDVVVPQKGGEQVFLYELWKDRASLDVHANTDRIKAHREGTKDLVAQSSITLCDVKNSGDA